MAKLNAPARRAKITTHEGATAVHINAEQQLRRLVMSCLLWEDQFYVDGQTIAKAIADAIPRVDADKVALIAVEAREKSKLRHVPLLICREMAKLPSHKRVVADTLARVIQRPDELTEYCAMYWKDSPNKDLSAQSKKGLAAAFGKFNAYSLAKYNRADAVKLRDVLQLAHPKPKDAEQAALWKQLLDGTLESPDTWEVALSAGKDKKATFERLIEEKKLGALALLRNLRNMQQAGVSQATVFSALAEMKTERVLPFRFIAAAKYVPQWEAAIEKAMLRALTDAAKLPGKTALVIDNSGSMHGPKVSAKSEIDRADAACALAILAREICEDVVVIGFGNDAKVIPARHGFALRDAIKAGPGGGTNTQNAITLAKKEGYDRLILITDEQSHQSIEGPGVEKRGYVINVASYQNGIGYGPWIHIDGWSESVLEFVRSIEEVN